MYPTWRHGKQTSSHRRGFLSRYDPIRDWLTCENLYGFTVLDFGAGGGYFTARLVEDFDAIVTAVESDPKAQPNLADSGAATIIAEHATPDRLKKLGRFDMVLALSVLHHCPQWRATLNTLRDAADILFVETADPREWLPKARAHTHSAAICSAVTDGKILIETPGHDTRYTRALRVIDQR